MNMTKYVIFLALFHISVSLVSQTEIFAGIDMESDTTTISTIFTGAVDSIISMIPGSYLFDAIFTGIKIALFAPMYTSKTLTMLSIHPALAEGIMIATYVVYGMWLRDLKLGKTFFD